MVHLLLIVLGLWVGGLLAFLSYRKVGRVPEIYCRKTTLNERLLAACPILTEPYWPTLGLQNRHLQTLLGVLGRRRANITFEVELFQLSDGGEILLDWVLGNFPENAPVVVVLHGSVGSSRSRYIRQFLKTTTQQKWRCVVMHARGCGVSELKTPKTFNAGLTSDIREVLEHVHERYSKTNEIYAVGFSMGANILAKYLGEDGPQAKVLGAVLLSNPWDFERVDARLHSPVPDSRLYNKLLRHEMHVYLKRHWKQIQNGEVAKKFTLEEVLRFPYIRDYDEQITSPSLKFPTVQDYYKASSSRHVAEKISMPTLVLHAKDDPVCPVESVPVEVAETNENLIIALTDRGGHLAWLEGWDFWEEAWMDRVVVQFINALRNCSNSSSNNTDISNQQQKITKMTTK